MMHNLGRVINGEWAQKRTEDSENLMFYFIPLTAWRSYFTFLNVSFLLTISKIKGHQIIWKVLKNFNDFITVS